MERKQIIFPNGNVAWVVIPPKNAGYPEILQALTIQQAKALVLVIGGAKNLDDSRKATLYPLFSNGIASTAAELGAFIIDGGTRSGVMEMMGQAVAEQERQSVLLGVAPEDKVTYQSQPADEPADGKTPLDPNHSHFVLVKGGKWGDETATMFGLVKELAQDAPVVTVLAGGGDIAKQEVLRSVRQGWPVIVIAGSGELADLIANLWRQKQAKPSFIQRVLRRPKPSLTISDRDIAEIIEAGDIYPFSHTGRPEELKALLKYLFLKQEKRVLAQTKERETLYAIMAGEHQKMFKQLQMWILGLGVLATALALGQTQLESLGWLKMNTIGDGLFHFFVVLVPIAVTVLLGITTYFKWGNKWVILRSSREALKQELYRYRTHTGIYEEKPTAEEHVKTQKSAEQQLVEKVKLITQRLMQTEVSTSVQTSPITPRVPHLSAADEDDGYSDLTPDRYIKFRLDDQLAYYRRRAVKWDRELKVCQSLVIIATGLGALLAAVQFELWLPLATAVGAAFGLYLEYMQVVNTLTKYNQAATNLEDVKQWWTALSESERKQAESFNKLVEATEQILESEQESWVQHMHNALDKLYKKDSTND
jgi:SLOG in TRPM, prokaryote/SMODS and SLOG-associating 2TM effector domain 1/Protein of unknown function (DUF4231)